MYFTLETAQLQVHPYMFAICIGSIPEARAIQRIIPDSPQDSAMPSVGRKRIRSGTLKQIADKAETGKHRKGKSTESKHRSVMIKCMLFFHIYPYYIYSEYRNSEDI